MYIFKQGTAFHCFNKTDTVRSISMPKDAKGGGLMLSPAAPLR